MAILPGREPLHARRQSQIDAYAIQSLVGPLEALLSPSPLPVIGLFQSLLQVLTVGRRPAPVYTHNGTMRPSGGSCLLDRTA